MLIKLSISVVLSLLFMFSNGQERIDSSISKKANNLFSSGVYLEDRHVLIPWNINVKGLANYGNPSRVIVNKRVTVVKWDSVKILNGIEVQLSTHILNKYLKDSTKLTYLFAYTHLADLETTRSYLDTCSGEAAKIHYLGKRYYYYRWIIDGCNLRLAYDRYNGSNLSIEKRSSP